MVKATAFGVDLAWSDGNSSGCVALDAHGRVVDERLLSSDGEIVGWLADLTGGAAAVAVDAPLLVPNDTGRRPCESDLARAYGSRKAGPHPCNRPLLIRTNGRIRGEDLRSMLEPLGFTDPWGGGRRVLLEVYPHPALIEAFSLPERLGYKKGRVGERRNGLRHLEELLARLAEADPPLHAPRIEIGDEVRGRALKDIEDLLDARVCAWVAAVWQRRRREGVRLFGTSCSGHIAVPIGPAV